MLAADNQRLKKRLNELEKENSDKHAHD